MTTAIVFPPTQEPDRTNIGALIRTNPGDPGFPNTTKWAGDTVTYSFPDAVNAAAYPLQFESPQALPVSEAVKTAVRESFENQFEPIIPVQFVEVADTTASQGIIRVIGGQFASPDVGGQADPPGDEPTAGDVQLAANLDADPDVYSVLYATVIHEIAHALSLNHPGNYDDGETPDPNAPGPFIPVAEDNPMNSIMTYNENEDDPAATSLMPYDIRALQFVYGTNTSFNAGDTTYKLIRDAARLEVPDVSNMSAENFNIAGKQTIWDGGGTDTIDALGLAADISYYFDLNPGGLLTAQADRQSSTYTAQPGQGPAGATYPIDRAGVRLSYDMTIENLLGTGGNDEAIGNSANNFLFGGGGNDTLSGNDGDDILSGNQGTDSLDGGNGNDFIVGGRDNDVVSGGAGDDPVVSGNIGNDVVNGDAGNDLLVGGQGDDTLLGGTGDDTLSGDFGRDVLTGGDGADTFVLRSVTAAADISQADVITDFAAGTDRIGLSAGATQSLEDTSLNGVTGTLVRDANGAILGFVNGVTAAQLSGQFVSTTFS